ncbi:hypothetical protein LCGC14_3125650 [marine sediment metagenome]|uniref:HNH nuclease domain-containing protein n=1 Tax=marine sediment metagenome TaxID=412755 RepID=A0A0F8WPZ4_9ZZZZ
MTLIKRKTMTRFWRKLSLQGDYFDSCWEWQAARNHLGYGLFQIDGKVTTASRAAWLIFNGDIPDGYDVCHRCDNPPCVNLLHLFLATKKENMQDMIAKGRHGWRDK